MTKENLDDRIITSLNHELSLYREMLTTTATLFEEVAANIKEEDYIITAEEAKEMHNGMNTSAAALRKAIHAITKHKIEKGQL